MPLRRRLSARSTLEVEHWPPDLSAGYHFRLVLKSSCT